MLQLFVPKPQRILKRKKSNQNGLCNDYIIKPPPEAEAVENRI